MIKKKSLSYLLASGMLAIHGATSYGVELSYLDNVDFHGFATQNYLYSTDNNFFGESEDGSFDFYEVGLNALWKPIPQLNVAAQIVARDAGETDDGQFRVDYAFLDYNWLNSDRVNSGIRIGRIANPLGFYNETRDIAATRPSILLPQSIYFDVNRNLSFSSDGVHLYFEKFSENSDISFVLGAGQPRPDDPDLETTLLAGEAPGSFDGDTSWAGRFLYDYDFGRVRLGITAAEINMDYDSHGSGPSFNLGSIGYSDLAGNQAPSHAPEAPYYPGEGKFVFRPIILSAQYQTETITYTTEYALRTTKTEGLRPEGVSEKSFTGTSYFVQASYRFNPSWSAFVRYDSLVWDNDDRDGKKFAESSTQASAMLGTPAVPAHSRFAKDWTVGLRWDINQHYLVSMEYHDIDGTGWLSRLENPIPSETEREWGLFLMSVSARF